MLKYKIDVLAALKAAGYNTTEIQSRGLIGQSSMHKIKNGIMVGNIVIDRICQLTGMQPGDIIEYVPEEEKEKEVSEKEWMEKVKIYREEKEKFLREISSAFNEAETNAVYDNDIEVTSSVGKLVLDQCSMLYHSACAPGIDNKPILAREKAVHIRYILYTAGPGVCRCITPNLVGDIKRIILKYTGINLMKLEGKKKYE